MLKINITPTTLVFYDLDDKMYDELTQEHGLKFNIEKGKYLVHDEPQNLYKVLYSLSCVYDIELI